jgi:uncharacterized membrane protein
MLIRQSWLRALRARARLLSAVAFGFIVYVLIPNLWAQRAESRLLIGWNACALLYLLLAWHMVREADAQEIKRRARQHDEGRLTVLSLVVLNAVAVLVAIASQLSAVKDLQGLDKTFPVALAALTVISGWLFTQTLFALHYAHDFYAARDRGEADLLEFPATADPEYSDFFYFAFVIGTSGQTADVPFTSSTLRRIGTVHCVLAFFFNTTVLALSINIAAGLF